MGVRIVEAAASLLLVLWSNYSWIAVPFLTLLLAAAVASFISYRRNQRNLRRKKRNCMEKIARLMTQRILRKKGRLKLQTHSSAVEPSHITNSPPTGEIQDSDSMLITDTDAVQPSGITTSRSTHVKTDNTTALQTLDVNDNGATKPAQDPINNDDEWSNRLLKKLSTLQFTDWKTVGLQVGLSKTTLDIIQANNQRDPNFFQQCKIDMLTEWIKKDDTVHGYEGGVKKMADALVHCGEGMLASTIDPDCAHRLDHLIPSPVELSSSKSHLPCISPFAQMLDQFAQYLKSVYNSRSFPTYFKIPVMRQRAKHFINLALVDYSMDTDEQEVSVLLQINGHVDEIRKRKRPLRIDEIGRLKDGRTAQYILIEGAPGIGKTTFAWELCRHWAQGKLLSQWPIFLLIQMRDKRIRQAKTLKDLFYHPEPHVTESVSQLLRDTDGKGVLLLFEGYDEISGSQLCDDSIFQQLLRKELLPLAGIIVSSRPISSQTLCEQFLGQIQQHVEIFGFSRDNIEAYVASACSEDSQLKDDFDMYISCHPFVSSTMYVPLYCSIITELYCSCWKEGKKEFAPKTLTEMYSALVLHLLQRHGNSLPAKYLENLPEDVYECLRDIGRFAADGIRKHQYIFDSLDCDDMGLMQVIPDYYARDSPSLSYSFQHQTLLEFLAAFYFAAFPTTELLNILQQPDLFPIQNYLKGEHRSQANTLSHWPVLLFIAGLTRLKNIPINLLQLFSTPEDDSRVKFHPAIFQLLFETQSRALISSVFMDKICCAYPWDMTLLDWFMQGYCIANSSPTSKWDIEFEHDQVQTVQGLEFFVMGIKYQHLRTFGGKIRSISLLGSDKLHECIRSILSLHKYTSDLSKLTLGGYIGPGSKTSVLLNKISEFFPHISRLQLSTDESFENWEALLQNLSSLKSLRVLELEASFSEKDAAVLNEQIQQCVTLKDLKLWFNETSDGTSSLIVGICPVVVGLLQSLQLERCSLDSSTTSAIALSLQSSKCSLQVLRLREISITVEDFSTLTVSIGQNISLKTFCLDDCGVNDTAILCLATALTQNTSLEDVEVLEHISEDTECVLKDITGERINLKLRPRDHLPKEILELLGEYQ